jgi:hypothetical protein
VRTTFSIEGTSFRDSRFDALDLDFSDGSVERSAFIASGNDAIDASGSVVELAELVVNGAGDKGVSAGERSRVSGARIDIRDATIGVASKDLSDVILSQLRLAGVEVGLAAYQKKSEYGPGRIVASAVTAEGAKRLHAIEERSVLSLDGVVVSSDQRRVAEQLYRVP